MRVSSSISYVLRLPGAFANAFLGKTGKRECLFLGLIPRTALRLSWAIFVRPAGTGEMPGRWEAWDSPSSHALLRTGAVRGVICSFIRVFFNVPPPDLRP